VHARIFLAAATALVSSAVSAAESNAIAVPIGNLLTQVLGILEPLAVSLTGAAVTWLLAKLGPDVARAFHAAHVDQVIARSIDAGFALVEGAEKGKVLEVPVANQVIRKAAQYIVDQAPGLFKELGDNLGQMLVARLSAAGALPANASAANLDLEPRAEAKKDPVRP
jgi:hypothetical protein